MSEEKKGIFNLCGFIESQSSFHKIKILLEYIFIFFLIVAKYSYFKCIFIMKLTFVSTFSPD